MATIDKQVEMDEQKRQKLAAKRLQRSTGPALRRIVEFVRGIAYSMAGSVSQSIALPRIQVDVINDDESESSLSSTDSETTQEADDTAEGPRTLSFYPRVLARWFSFKTRKVTPDDGPPGGDEPVPLPVPVPVPVLEESTDEEHGEDDVQNKSI